MADAPFRAETERLIAAVEGSRHGRQAKRVTCERSCVLSVPCQHRHVAVEWSSTTPNGKDADFFVADAAATSPTAKPTSGNGTTPSAALPRETYLGPRPWHAPCIAALEAHLGLPQTRHMVAAGFNPHA